jgi:hypothetical protein
MPARAKTAEKHYNTATAECHIFLALHFFGLHYKRVFVNSKKKQKIQKLFSGNALQISQNFVLYLLKINEHLE